MSTKIRPLSPRLQEVARREVNEDPSRREQDIKHIKEWLAKQPHLNARTDDQWLLTFLRGCKFSLEKTKEKLDFFYTMRTMLPDIFSNRDPLLPEIQEILKKGNHLPLPVLDDQGRRILVVRIGAYDPKKVNFETVMKVNFMIMDIMLVEDDDYIISGDVSLIDFGSATMSHIMQMTPSLTKKMTTVVQDAYPFRPQGLNYISIPSFFMTIFGLFQSILKEKLRKRLHLHGKDLESLYKNIPRKNLPTEYGGDAGSLVDISAVWKKKVESYREWFLDDEKYKSNEKKRVGKPKTHETVFGLEGSFRQLALD